MERLKMRWHTQQKAETPSNLFSCLTYQHSAILPTLVIAFWMLTLSGPVSNIHSGHGQWLGSEGTIPYTSHPSPSNGGSIQHEKITR